MNGHLKGTELSVARLGEQTVEQVIKEQTVGAMIDRLQETDDTNNPHAFVVMPFGQKVPPAVG